MGRGAGLADCVGPKEAGLADAVAADVADKAQVTAVERALPAVLALVVGCALVQPRAVPVFVALLALVLVAMTWQWRGGMQLSLPQADNESLPARLWQAQPATVAVLGFAAYCALTAAWSPVPAATLAKVSWLVLLVLMAAVGVRLLPASGEPLRTRMLIAIAVLSLLGAVFVALEVWRGQAIMRFLYNAVPFLHPGPNKHVTLDKGIVTAIGPWVMNRNVGALNMLLWPALLCIFALGRVAGPWHGRHVGPAIALVVATGTATILSQHESSQIAIILSAGVFLLARLSLPLARAVVLAGWLCAVLAMLPVVVAAHKSGLHESRYIPETGQARIILWNFTATKFLERPAFGFGAYAIRSIDDELKPRAKAIPGQAFAQRTGQHSHNFFVQTWFELGAIGAIIFLICGVLIWRALGALSSAAQPYALAASTSAMCLAALTWGFWQEWYLSLFAIAILLTALGNGAIDRAKEGQADDFA
jgi:O-Antigen ligase